MRDTVFFMVIASSGCEDLIAGVGARLQRLAEGSQLGTAGVVARKRRAFKVDRLLSGSHIV